MADEELIDDQYQFVMSVASGSSSQVWEVAEKGTARHLAMKILKKDNPEFKVNKSKMKKEAQIQKSLEHPMIVKFEKFSSNRDHTYIIMEYFRASNLKLQLKSDLNKVHLKIRQLFEGICTALSHVHQKGYVHRDIKPDNVLMTLHGVPKLADFGLAKRVVREGEVNLPDGLCGTPHFMAPELFQGIDAGTATDVYALGVSYFLMLTGRCPYSGDTLNRLMTSLTNDPVPNVRRIVPDVSLEMAECLNQMLDKNPANRPPDGIKAAQLLQAILGQARDLDTLLAEAFRDDTRVGWSREGGQRYKLTVHLPGGRRQVIYIEPSAHGSAERLLLIYSTCCAAHPAYYEAALRLNSEMPHGSVAIREIGGQSKFVVVDTYPRATVDAEEIRRSTHEVASRADAIEKLLTGLDRE